MSEDKDNLDSKNNDNVENLDFDESNDSDDLEDVSNSDDNSEEIDIEDMDDDLDFFDDDTYGDVDEQPQYLDDYNNSYQNSYPKKNKNYNKGNDNSSRINDKNDEINKPKDDINNKSDENLNNQNNNNNKNSNNENKKINSDKNNKDLNKNSDKKQNNLNNNKRNNNRPSRTNINSTNRRNPNNSHSGSNSLFNKKGKKGLGSSLFNRNKDRLVSKKGNSEKEIKKTFSNLKKFGKSVVSFFTKPSGVIILFIVGFVLLFLIIVTVFMTSGPNVFGSVKDQNNVSSYSEVDQKTIENINSISDKYSNGNPGLAMTVVVYPYFPEIQNGNVYVLRSNKGAVPDLVPNADDDAEDEEYNELDSEDPKYNDQYLTIMRNKDVLKRFEQVLEKTENLEEDEFKEYLREDYFPNDTAYQFMFYGIENDDKIYNLQTEIINDIYNLSSEFSGYFYENCVTSGGTMTYLNAAGEVEGFTGDIYVTLRDYRSTGGKFIKEDYYNAPVLYNTNTNPLPFSRYVMGVVYAEAGESCVTNEVCAKTLMITAKSFALGRQKSMNYDYEVDESSNRTIIHMRGNVGDQDFCDVYEGCKSGTYSKETWTYTGEGYNNRKGALSSDKITQLETWWNDIANEYVVKKSNNSFAGSQYNDYNSNCKKGYCVSQTKVAEASKTETDYKNVLYNSENGGFDNAQYVAYLSDSNGVYAVSTGDQICTEGTNNETRQKIVDFARSMVGKIPYYYYGGQSDGYGALGHAISKNFDENHFGEDASISDQSGRNKYGLDCSGFVNFVFWNVLDNNLGNGNTDNLKSISTEIQYSELKPGDLGFISNDSAGTEQHVGIYIGDDKWVELNPNGVTEGPYPDFKVYYRLNILADLDANEQVGEMYDDMENAIQGQFFAPVQQNLKMYGKNSTNGNTYHDLGASCGTPVYAPADGTATFKTITKNGKVASYGNEVEINTSDGYRIVLAHLESFVGYNALYGSESTYPSSCTGGRCTTDTYGTRDVKKGEMVGKSGTSGNSTGCHLHIEIWRNGTRLEPSDLLGYDTR